MQPGAGAGDLGAMFEYRIKEPVTIARNESALVPILNAAIAAEPVSIWSRASGSGRPLRAVWIMNTSGLTLDGGSFSVVEADAFAGEGLMEPLAPGERRLLSYATDLRVLVSAEAANPTGRIARVRAADGLIVQETEERASIVYRIRNEDSTPRAVVIEHPVHQGWTLADTLEPAERSPNMYRFRVPVDARGQAVLEVGEARATESRISVGEFRESLLDLWTRSGLPVPDLERALTPVIDLRRQIAAIEARGAQHEAERHAIFADQQRLRENMKVLRGSTEERKLLARYTRQLDAHESRLEVLERETARDADALRRLQQELAKRLGEAAFEVRSVLQ
jgi:hypothetical protein